jgi:hypothetical protein
LLLWIFIYGVAPGLVYRTQRRWFPLSQDKFSLVMYSFLALYKMLFLMFNLVPYLALLIMG